MRIVRPSLRTWLSIVAALVVAAGFAFWLSRDGARQVRDFSAAWENIGPAAILLAALVALVQIVCQAGRFAVVARESAGIQVLAAGRIFIFGQAANLFLPARAGDLGKVAATAATSSRGTRPEVASAAAIVLADKFVDATSMVLIALLVVPGALAQIDVPWLRPSPWWILGGALLVAAVLWLPLPVSWRAKIVVVAGKLRETFRNMAHPRAIFLAFAVGFAAWTAETLGLHILAVAVGYPLSPGALFTALIAVNIGTAIPLTPAQIGTFEASLGYGLSLSGVPAGHGLVIATIYHALQIASVVVWSLVSYVSVLARARVAPSETG